MAVETAKKIITMEAGDAKGTLLKSESYFEFGLPSYFDFSALLQSVDQKLAGNHLPALWDSAPGDFYRVNHVIFHSKDGQYAWRPQELMHPFIYVELVREMTAPENWSLLQEKFSEFEADARIECVSQPVVSQSDQKDKAAQIYSWWLEMEQRSLELSLKYDYVLQTDIADCYGSIYTHSFSWALHGKEYAKSKEGKADKSLLGNKLDKLVRWSRQNQTNGIPQGSNLNNLMAEILLGYADSELSKASALQALSDFKILRYRDDYRIFTKDAEDGARIAQALAEVLQGLGMKLSPAKTSSSNEVIKASIKEDKLFWIGKEKRKKSMIKHALLIHELAAEHPNSGSVSSALTKFQKRLVKVEETKDPILPIVGVVTDIAVKNPRVYPVYAAILSKLLSLMSSAERDEVLSDVKAKFKKVPNSGQLQIWLQRFALPMGLVDEFSEPLCMALLNDEFQLWNSDWLPSACSELLVAKNYVDQEQVDSLDMVIGAEEVQLFDGQYY